MEVLLYAFIAVLTILGIYLIIDHPYKVAIILVFMILYRVNIETPLFIDLRGILLILLFLRLCIFDKENLNLIINKLLNNIFFWLILIFTAIILIDPISNAVIPQKYLKDFVLTMITVMLGFILTKNEESQKSIFYGIILAGIFSSVDLLFTLSTTGSLNILKVLDLALGKKTIVNHSFPAFLASIGLLFVYYHWYNSIYHKKLLLVLALILSGAVIFSTSRSVVLATVLTLVLMTIKEPKLKHNLRTIIRTGLVLAVLFISFFFVYNTFLEDSNNRTYIDKLYYRIYAEPLQMVGIIEKKSEFNKWTGESAKGGSMEFRSERWQDDLEEFSELSFAEQFFGLGPLGFLQLANVEYFNSGNVRRKLAPHNGFIYLMLERGILGVVLFLTIAIFLLLPSFKLSQTSRVQFPFQYLLVLIIIYSFPQNAELTSIYTYLAFGLIIGNLKFSRNN